MYENVYIYSRPAWKIYNGANRGDNNRGSPGGGQSPLTLLGLN